MARSKWKFIFFSKKILHKLVSFSYIKKPSRIFLKARSTTIPFLFYKKKLSSYQGLTWNKFKVKHLHVGHKVGEFSLTKKPFYFPIKEKKKKKLYKR